MLHRNIDQALLAALQDTRVVLLHGARQTGKTTLAQWLADGPYPSRYLTLDDAATLAAALNDPGGFVSGLTCPVVLDEVQRAPRLFPAIKARVDREREPGSFLLTGSADLLVLPGLSEHLAGRIEVLTLWPLSQGEIDGRREEFIDIVFAGELPATQRRPESRGDLVRRVVRGGYPEVQSRHDDSRRRAWFGAYVTTLLQREVRELASVEGLGAMPRLLALVAARVSSLANFSELSRSLGMPLTTVKRYFALLEATFLVQLLPAWSSNMGKRLVKAPKLLLNDTGLAAHQLGAEAEKLVESADLLGPLLENFVAMELRKQVSWSRTQPRLFHFRAHSGEEVDIVLEDPSGRIVGIEVKAAASVEPRDLRGLRQLSAAVGKSFRAGLVLYTGSASVPFGAKLHALPISTLWQGSQLKTP